MIGNAVMWFLAVVVKDSLPEKMQDSPLIKWGGVPIILLIILILERRYSAMKRAFEEQKKNLAEVTQVPPQVPAS